MVAPITGPLTYTPMQSLRTTMTHQPNYYDITIRTTMNDCSLYDAMYQNYYEYTFSI